MRGTSSRAGLAAALAAATLAAGPLAAADDDAPRLRFDPFARPEPGAAGGGYRDGARPAVAWAPVLTATLVAGPESLANLGGVVLALGQETGGYRLVEVREFEAVFEHAGEPVVLRVTRPRKGTR